MLSRFAPSQDSTAPRSAPTSSTVRYAHQDSNSDRIVAYAPVVVENTMLRPMTPQEAVNDYLEDVQGEVARTTYENHMSRLQRFLEWADDYGLDDMNNISGSKLHEFKQHRKQDIAKITLKNQLGTIRQFLEFCEDIDVAPNGVSRKVRLPSIELGEDVNDVHITQKEAEKVLEYCEDYEYATMRYTVFYILWETGMRTGALRGLDVDDFVEDTGVLSLNHRPESDTPLKNKDQGARDVYITEELSGVICDFLEMHHPYVEDDHGRMPLVGGENGRTHGTTIQRNVYTLTRPCHYTNECPHGRDLQDCEATSYNTASKCPTSVSPHAVRKGSVTSHRKKSVPKDVTGERMDMSGDVLDKHYDKRTEREKMEQRREYLDNI